jgi:clan AA aspartic protease
MNSVDRELALRGTIALDDVRSVRIEDMLVDTGATTVCLPTPLIERLGLRPKRAVHVRTALGDSAALIFGNVEVELQGRSVVAEVLELPGGSEPLLGVLPLEALGAILDMDSQTITLAPDNNAQTYLSF